jgi:hypothetical protein
LSAGQGQRPRFGPWNGTGSRPVLHLVFCCHGAKAPAALRKEAEASHPAGGSATVRCGEGRTSTGDQAPIQA